MVARDAPRKVAEGAEGIADIHQTNAEVIDHQTRLIGRRAAADSDAGGARNICRAHAASCGRRPIVDVECSLRQRDRIVERGRPLRHHAEGIKTQAWRRVRL